MALQNQIHIYSVDTEAFYTEKEQRVNLMKKRYEKRKRESTNKDKIKHYNHKIKQCKAMLKRFFSTNKKIRHLNNLFLVDKNIISVFESSLTRIIGADTDELTKDMIIVQTYYYEVFRQLVEEGFLLNGEKYRIFTASAGQIRTHKTVFIKESVWEEYNKTLTCGLDILKINEKGGVNVNKYLAYLALTNTASDLWENFDIDKCIVVDDFETSINTKVDYINKDTFEITENIDMPVHIPHMDGCGIMLPKVSKKAFMVRAPWVKGLLVPFKFDVFIKENYYKGITSIKDIYGKEYDIIKDDIQIIFTKSQFKMWKYYESWEEYKRLYKKYGCQAGKCNEEPEKRGYARLTYQALQTLTDISDEELIKIAEQTNLGINKIANDRNSMMSSLGVTDYNINKNFLQKSLDIYPELIQDTYTKKILRDIRKRMIKEGRSGRLSIQGMYTFIVPDLYAFCEWLFLKNDNPSGLLKNGEVSCKLFKKHSELDVLRFPHLFLEHAVRGNVLNKDISKWFISDGIHTSVHDPISRILQFDNDGDQSLVVSDNTFVEVAKRNAKGIIPLYYEMAKAGNQLLSKEAFYNGMIASYSGSNIGVISNEITKVWNSEDVNLKVIKYLCCINNFAIDYAKTLYKPDIPDNVKQEIKNYTKSKVPAFFEFAKGKTENQVEKRNKSTVNRIYDIIESSKIRFNYKSAGKFDYKKLMRNSNVEIDYNIVENFKKLNRNKGHIINSTDRSNIGNAVYINKKIKENMLDMGDKYYVVDVLIKYLFCEKKSTNKTTFWDVFGDVVFENLEINLKDLIEGNFILCESCGKRIRKTNNRIKFCEKCSKEKNKENMRKAKKIAYHSKKSQI